MPMPMPVPIVRCSRMHRCGVYSFRLIFAAHQFVRYASSVRRVCVIGSGQMGCGIAYTALAVARVPVTLIDASDTALKSARAYMEATSTRAVSKGKLDNAAAEFVRGELRTHNRIDALRDDGAVDFVIEAVTESLAVKTAIYAAVDAAMSARSDYIIASNTSSISITQLAAATRQPNAFIGMHFMNPVPVMPLIELIPALTTDDATVQTTKKLAAALGKTVTVSRDVPGFIANRLLMPYINEAIQLLDHGVGTREDIDATMKLGCNMPLGPLQLADFIGLDTCLAIMETLHSGIGDDKYRPATLLRQLVHAKRLGKKNGRGFYEYHNG